MKVSELKHGNLIKIELSHKIQEVIDVMCDGVNTQNYEGVHYGIVHPIPLTEQWLLNFGFEEIIVEDYPTFLLDGFMIEIYIDNCIVCYNNIEITKIKFVHSLQNLYFELTGDELKLKKNEK